MPSEQARRFAKRHKKPKQTLTEVPLDRRRNVPLSDMTEEELKRALTQSEGRVDRAQELLTRYELMVHSIRLELATRGSTHVLGDVPEPDENLVDTLRLVDSTQDSDDDYDADDFEEAVIADDEDEDDEVEEEPPAEPVEIPPDIAFSSDDEDEKPRDEMGPSVPSFE